VAKDRAAPFSKKHRRYWLPVTGGMVVIGALNVGLGVCTYERAGDPEPIHVQPYSPADAALAPGELGIAQIPGEVMRAFATRYPKTIPAGARLDGGNVVVRFPPGATHQSATFSPDGTFVSEQ
jgi:hypothetical protein